MKRNLIPILMLFSVVILKADDIEVSQDTLLQNLNYGATTDRTITITNNTSSAVNLSITLVDQTWIPPLVQEPFQENPVVPDVPNDLGFSNEYICGTPDPSPAEVLITVEQVERWLEQQDRNSRNIVNVQIAWHVIHAVSGTGALSSNQIAAQVTWLNNAFADHNFIFTLASVDYTENNDWFYNMYDLDGQVKSQLYTDPYHHMNVYTASIFSDGVAGYAYLPQSWPEGSYMHGIVLDYRTLPYAGGYDGDIAVHEAGHYLGLNHTFYNNCSTGNDGVDDTPAHHDDYLWQCNNNLDSCSDLPGNDPIHNYMTYTNNSCQWEFTPGQKDRMHALVATYRPGLLENPVAPLWMTTADETVTVPANSTLDVDFTFDATNTYGGTYYGDVIFTAATPDTAITVSATLNITGFPEIGLNTTVLSFSDTYINNTSAVSLEISNLGSDYLDISSFEFDYDYFFTEAQVASIPPSESEEITIYFIPDSIGSFSGIMTINSNDDDDPAVDVTLYGMGVPTPLLLSFSSLIDTLASNSVNSHLLTLSNTGNVSLDYQINHDIGWLTISPENGTIPAFNTELIQFNISTLFMNYGEYNGTIEIETSVGVFYVEVTIIVAELNIDNDIAGIPHTFKVHENFPNPFNPVTKVQIDVPEFGHAIIQVHDVSGRLITTLVNEELRPGFHSIQWNGKNQLGESVSSGVYILNVRFENLNISQKMLLVK